MDVRIRDKLCKMVIHVWIDMNTERIEVEKFKYNIVISIGLIIRKSRVDWKSFDSIVFSLIFKKRKIKEEEYIDFCLDHFVYLFSSSQY